MFHRPNKSLGSQYLMRLTSQAPIITEQMYATIKTGKTITELTISPCLAIVGIFYIFKFLYSHYALELENVNELLKKIRASIAQAYNESKTTRARRNTK
jgi:hypothetical protein